MSAQILWAGSSLLMAQTTPVKRSELFVGIRYAEQVPITVNAAILDQARFRGQHKGIELGYYRRLRNGGQVGIEVFGYVSRYSFTGKIATCSSVMEDGFPYTSEGSRKGIAVYDPLVLTANYGWRVLSGNRNEWRFSFGAGVMPFFSRSVTFHFDSGSVAWACPQTLAATLGYGDDIFPVMGASFAYHVGLCGGHGLQLRTAFTSSLFEYYSGYVAVDRQNPAGLIAPWQRRFSALSVSVRYDLAW